MTKPELDFDVYKIDYGCYVDLINTTKSPQGLFQFDDGEDFAEVPRDDYRSIRRAILLPETLRAFSGTDSGKPAPVSSP